METTRTRADRCPGVFRPWAAEDGLLVRLRLIGGRIPVGALIAVLDLAEEYGDGHVHTTLRANLQLRALPGVEAGLDTSVVRALEATGLVPSPAHDLVRNVLVSPQTGLAGGQADLRPVAAELDRRVRCSDLLAGLPGRFLFVLDDGRGDLIGHKSDLALVALDATTAQVRVGEAWADVVALEDAPARMVALAEDFVRRRGEGPHAAWHVVELAEPLGVPASADPRTPQVRPALAFGPVPGGIHIPVGEAGIDRDWMDRAMRLTGTTVDQEFVITPWKGVLVPHSMCEEKQE